MWPEGWGVFLTVPAVDEPLRGAGGPGAWRWEEFGQVASGEPGLSRAQVDPQTSFLPPPCLCRGQGNTYMGWGNIWRLPP